MASRLAPCPSCTRHYKLGSFVCPFCRAEVPAHAPARGLPLPPGRRLTRAALMFAGVSVVTACGGETVASLASDGGGDPHPVTDPIMNPDPVTHPTPDSGADAARSPARDDAGPRVPAMDATPPDAPVDADTPADASVIHPIPDDAGPGGPHCGAGPAAYGVFIVPDACP